MDASALFDSYHAHPTSRSKAERMLRALPKVDSEPLLIRPGARSSVKSSKFYQDVLTRVYSYLGSKGHQTNWLLFEIFLTLIACILSYVCMYSVEGVMRWFAVIVYASCRTRLGFAMHHGNHSAISSNSWLNRTIGYLMDFIGASSDIWRIQHDAWHHSYPNDVTVDTDARIGAPFFRLHSAVSKHWCQKILQPFVLVLLTGVTGVKWVIGDISHAVTGQFSGHLLSPVLMARIRIAAIFRFFWILFIWVYIPYLFVSHSDAFMIWLVGVLITGYQLALTFLVNHIQAPYSLKPQVSLHWAVEQVFETTNWSSGHHFWNWVSGGLNHQIEHHLFPNVSYYHYPAISHIVKRCCIDHGLPYRSWPNFSQAFLECMRFLLSLSSSKN